MSRIDDPPVIAKHRRQGWYDRPVMKLIVEGNPVHRILEIAREKKIDLIVLGHHEEGTLERFFLGRNIDRIVDHSDCAVLIIRTHFFREEKNQEAVADRQKDRSARHRFQTATSLWPPAPIRRSSPPVRRRCCLN
jgi:Universal stress protein family